MNQGFVPTLVSTRHKGWFQGVIIVVEADRLHVESIIITNVFCSGRRWFCARDLDKKKD
jgi:hypothetical protein